MQSDMSYHLRITSERKSGVCPVPGGGLQATPIPISDQVGVREVGTGSQSDLVEKMQKRYVSVCEAMLQLEGLFN